MLNSTDSTSDRLNNWTPTPTPPSQHNSVGGIDDNNITTITESSDSNSLTSKPADSLYYAVSDLAVGGRCKCELEWQCF